MTRRAFILLSNIYTSHMIEIIQKDNKTLRKTAKAVNLSDIKSNKFHKTLRDMTEALESQHDGVALAAPQINISLRIFIVSPKAYRHEDKEHEHLVFINPEIIKKSSDKKLVEEGCLSVRHWYGKIRRASRATVSAYDENGEEFEMEGSGLLAQIFQHEIDHLDGILFIDNAVDLEEFTPKDEIDEE
jgi:peptide deformylase